MREQGGGPFEDIDPKLTIYALANGMDLAKEPGVRRLGWYREGREREVCIATRDDGPGFAVVAAAFRTGGGPPARSESAVGEADSVQALLEGLSDLLARGQEEADRL